VVGGGAVADGWVDGRNDFTVGGWVVMEMMRR
jgi:hypothetical protein